MQPIVIACSRTYMVRVHNYLLSPSLIKKTLVPRYVGHISKYYISGSATHGISLGRAFLYLHLAKTRSWIICWLKRNSNFTFFNLKCILSCLVRLWRPPDDLHLKFQQRTKETDTLAPTHSVITYFKLTPYTLQLQLNIH